MNSLTHSTNVNTNIPKALFLVTEDWDFCLHRLSLARAVRDAGYDVSVATRVNEHGPLIVAEGFRLIPVRLSRGSRNPLAEFNAVRELAAIYKAEKPDIVHHIGIKPILYGSWAARIAGQGGVVNAFAGLGYVYTDEKLSTKIIRHSINALFRRIFRHPSTTAIFQNTDDCETLRRQCGLTPERSVVIRGSGVDENEFVPVGEPEGDPVVLLAGRMLWDKGIREFAEAAAEIRRRGVPARFVLAGRCDPDNPSSIPESQLREWEQSGLLTWWGQQDNMPAVIAKCHIVALPSYREGLPKVLLEAAASTRPVVATDVPGCREIVRDGENGFLVPAKNSTALAEALIRLIQDGPLREAMGLAGRKLVIDDLTTRHVTSRFLDIYSNLLFSRKTQAGFE